MINGTEVSEKVESQSKIAVEGKANVQNYSKTFLSSLALPPIQPYLTMRKSVSNLLYSLSKFTEHLL
jgi:hypothetical protein